MDSVVIPITTALAALQGLNASSDFKSYVPMLVCLAGGVAMAIVYVKFLRAVKSDDDAKQG